MTRFADFDVVDDEPDHPVFYPRGDEIEELHAVMGDIQRKRDSKSACKLSGPSPAVRVSGAPASALGQTDKVQTAMHQSEAMTPGAVHHAPGHQPVRASPPSRFFSNKALLPRRGPRAASTILENDSTASAGAHAYTNDISRDTTRATARTSTHRDSSESIVEAQAVLLHSDSSRALTNMDSRKRRQKITRIAAIVGSSLIVIIAIILGVLLTLDFRDGGKAETENDAKHNENDNSTASSHPDIETEEKMAACVKQQQSPMNERFMEIQTTILSEFASLEDAIVSPGTSARAALCWMAHVDSISSSSVEQDANSTVLDIPDSSESQKIQRFAMAVVYYHFVLNETTDGGSPNKLLSSNWLTPAHVCSWDYVDCHDASQTVASLNLVLCKLKGSIPSELALLTALTVLDLGINLLSGDVPSELWSMTRLEQLGVVQNAISGTISNNIQELSQLRLIYLSENQFTGTLPDLNSLANLELVEVQNNKFGGTIPTFQGMTSLVSLRLGGIGSSTTGTIPTEIFLLTNLESLEISNLPSITGIIPTEIGRLSELRTLALFQLLAITGTIPTELGLLTNLESLDLRAIYKQSGTIPSEIGLLTNLVVLSLQENNALTGAIPSEICSLPALVDFDSPLCDDHANF